MFCSAKVFDCILTSIEAIECLPMAEVDACCIVLDKSSEAKLLSLVDARGFSVQEGHLAAQADNDFGDHGMVWIHSRKQGGKTLISTQCLICENNLLAEYQSEEAYQDAVDSYGGVSDVYLTPSGKLKPTSTSSSPVKPAKPSTPSDGSDSDNPSTLSNSGSDSSNGETIEA